MMIVVMITTITAYKKRLYSKLAKGMFKLFSKNMKITLTGYFSETILTIIHPISQMQMM